MELLIVTGLSGAGKSQTANALEDIGYYCVDNVPPALIPAFVEIGENTKNQLSKMAVVTDTRGGDLFQDIEETLEKLKLGGVDYKILFLDSSDDVLVRRYKEHRRKHPLNADGTLSLPEAVKKDRLMLEKIRMQADYIIDTTHILTIISSYSSVAVYNFFVAMSATQTAIATINRFLLFYFFRKRKKSK